MICINCVTPSPLKVLIAKNGSAGICHYCDGNDISVSRTVLFEYIFERIKENLAFECDLSGYELGMLYDCGDDSVAIASLDVVLAEWLGIDNDPYIDDLEEHAPLSFKQSATGAEIHFFIDDGMLEKNAYQEKWEEFVADITHSHRFFNSNTKDFLDSVFSLITNEKNVIKAECTRIISKGEAIYRARAAESYEDAKKINDDPINQFGPPPKNKASSQRMTPNGISAMYCSLERETCLSEIRAITGDDVVSVGLTPVYQLKLLDLTKLKQIKVPNLSKLEKGYLDAHHLKSFLNSLVKKMSKPKNKNDDLSYLQTQVVFEYLRLRFGSQVDGLVIPSVQTGEVGTNIVLFPEASVIGAKKYTEADDMEKAFGDSFAEIECPFDLESEAKLVCISDSIRFHKIKAIKTESLDYDNIYALFMNDLTKDRLQISK